MKNEFIFSGYLINYITILCPGENKVYMYTFIVKQNIHKYFVTDFHWKRSFIIILKNFSCSDTFTETSSRKIV